MAMASRRAVAESRAMVPSGEAREAARFAVEHARGLRDRLRAQIAAVERARELLRAEILAARGRQTRRRAS